MTNWLIDQSTYQSIDWFIHWLIPWFYTDCTEGKNSGYYPAMKGLYQAKPSTASGPVQLRCDFQVDQVVLMRWRGDVDFNVTKASYVIGFGDANADYWTGLERLHLVTSNSHTYTLGVQVRTLWMVSTRKYSTGWEPCKHWVGLVDISNRSQFKPIRRSAWFPPSWVLPRAHHPGNFGVLDLLSSSKFHLCCRTQPGQKNTILFSNDSCSLRQRHNCFTTTRAIGFLLVMFDFRIIHLHCDFVYLIIYFTWIC